MCRWRGHILCVSRRRPRSTSTSSARTSSERTGGLSPPNAHIISDWTKEDADRPTVYVRPAPSMTYLNPRCRVCRQMEDGAPFLLYARPERPRRCDLVPDSPRATPVTPCSTLTLWRARRYAAREVARGRAEQGAEQGAQRVGGLTATRPTPQPTSGATRVTGGGQLGLGLMRRWIGRQSRGHSHDSPSKPSSSARTTRARTLVALGHLRDAGSPRREYLRRQRGGCRASRAPSANICRHRPASGVSV